MDRGWVGNDDSVGMILSGCLGNVPNVPKEKKSHVDILLRSDRKIRAPTNCPSISAIVKNIPEGIAWS